MLFCLSIYFIVFLFLIFQILQLIDDEVFCVHGGLSPDISTLDQIRVIERNQEIPYKGNTKRFFI